ncbi:hypothetical protein HELRODRAFT_182524 [Helobdella robusta]|uniref:Uncharacterized protein n=1 Tax=Helobdella robusta TaxID=6412 RepID=T1FIB5_HELRO|nr:hypothetical protein HELRODRAFT_182524 [Helobdella robusta]ESN90816.1 hypothetical protein HELRODRAFT_182524 [Helobdella robusta]
MGQENTKSIGSNTTSHDSGHCLFNDNNNNMKNNETHLSSNCGTDTLQEDDDIMDTSNNNHSTDIDNINNNYIGNIITSYYNPSNPIQDDVSNASNRIHDISNVSNQITSLECPGLNLKRSDLMISLRRRSQSSPLPILPVIDEDKVLTNSTTALDIEKYIIKISTNNLENTNICHQIPKPSEDSMETLEMMPQVRKKLINPSKCIGSNSDSSSKNYVSISNVDEMGENIAEYVEVTEVNFTSTISKLADDNNNTYVINNADKNVDDIDNTDINKTDNNADVTSTNDINSVINVDNANNDFNYNIIVDNINASVSNMTIDENVKKFDAYNNNIGPSTDFKESTMSPSSSSEFSQSNNKFTNDHDNNRNNRMIGDRVQNLALHEGIEVSALTTTLLQRSNEQQQQQCINYKLRTDEFMKMIDDIIGSCDNVNDNISDNENTSKDEALHSDVDVCTKLFERLSVCNSDFNNSNVNDVNNSTGPNKVDTNNSIDANKIDVDNLIDANKIVVGNLVDSEKNDVDSFFDSVKHEDGVINIEPPISKNYIDDNSKNCFKEYNVKDVDADSPNDSYNECFIINKSNQPAAAEHQIETTNCNIDNKIKDITNDNNNNDNSHNNNASSNIENDNNDASSNDDCNNFVTNSLPTVKKSFTKDFEGLDMNSDPSRLGFDVVSKTDNDDGDIHIADVLSSDMNVGCMEVEERGGEEKVKKLGGLINRTFGEMDDNNDGLGALSSSEIRSDDVVKFNEMRMDDDSKIVEVIHTTVYERKDEIYDSAGAVGSVDNTGDSKCNVEDIRENIFVSNSPPITKKIVAIDFDKLDIDSDPTKLTSMLTDGVLSQYGTNQTEDVDKMKKHCGFVSNSDGVSMNNFEIVNNEKKNHISPDDTKKLFNTTLKQLSCENKCHKNNNFKDDDEVPISPAAVVNKPTGMNMSSNFNTRVLKLSTEQLETAADQKEAFAESRPSSLRSSSPALMPPTHPIINWDHIDEHSDPALFCKSSSSSFIINTNNSGDNYKNKNDDDYDDKGTTKDNFKTLSPTKVTEKRTTMKKKSVGPPRHAKDGEKKCAAECSAGTTDDKLESKKPPVKRFQRPVNLTKLTGSAVGKNNCNDDEDVLILLPPSKNSLITSSTTTTPSTMTSSAMARTSSSSPSSHLKNVDSINIGEVNVDNQLDRVQQSDSNSLNHFASSSFLDTSLSFDTIKGSDGNLSISSIEPSSLNPVLCSSILESDLQINCVKLSDDSIPNDTINSCNDVINDNSNNSGNISNNVSNINKLDISRSSNRKMNVMNFSVEEMKNFLKLPGPAITTFAATTAATADGATDTNVDIFDRTLCENDASMQQTGVVELGSVLINEHEGKPTFKSASEVFGDPTQWDVLEKYTSKMNTQQILDFYVIIKNRWY